MAGMTQDMALVEFVTVYSLRNGWHFLKVYISAFKGEYNGIG